MSSSDEELDPIDEEIVDWRSWYNETLDALVGTIAGGADRLGLATDPDGDPYIVVGSRATAGVQMPAVFIPEFGKSITETSSSDERDELHTIETTLWVVYEGDATTQEANLREAINRMGDVETFLYANRRLDRTANRLDVVGSNATTSLTDNGTALQFCEIEIEIMKTAEHDYW